MQPGGSAGPNGGAGGARLRVLAAQRRLDQAKEELRKEQEEDFLDSSPTGSNDGSPSRSTVPVTINTDLFEHHQVQACGVQFM